MDQVAAAVALDGFGELAAGYKRRAPMPPRPPMR